MMASVLRSKQAVQVNIAIVRAFIRLREIVATNAEIAALVRRHDQEIGVLFEHVEQMLQLREPEKRPIGFQHPRADEDDD
jgi:hypothetical protein